MTTTNAFALPLRTLEAKTIGCATLFMAMLVAALGYTPVTAEAHENGQFKIISSVECYRNDFFVPKCEVQWTKRTGRFQVFAAGRTQEDIKAAIRKLEADQRCSKRFADMACG